MTATTTTPNTVSFRPRTLAAMLAATVAASIGVTWTAAHSSAGSVSDQQPAVPTLAPTTQAYIDGIAAMSPAELAAAYGYNNYPSPATQAYIDGIVAMSPAELAAAYGYNDYSYGSRG